MQTQPARHDEPFFDQDATARDFEDALRRAVRVNADSMDDLHAAIRNCVAALRTDGMNCEAALLTMKACVRHYGRKHRPEGSVDSLYSGFIMDQIVTWSIADYYEGNQQLDRL
jgi:hypothetical protein